MMMIYLSIIWVVVISVAMTMYYRKTYSFFRSRGVKAGRVFPPFGSMFKVLLRTEHYVDALNRVYYKFPKERFVGSFEFVNPVLIVRDLELIKKITVKDFDHFLDHRQMIDEITNPLFGRNLFSLRGQEWKDMRSTLSPAFTSSKLKAMVPFIVDVMVQMIISIKNKIKNSDSGEVELEVHDLTTRSVNDVIASCAFGLKVDSHSDPDNDFYKQALIASTFNFKELLVVFLTLAFPKFMSNLNISLFTETTRRFFRSLVMDTMRDREKKKIIRPDMIHLLMEAKKGNLKHEKPEDSDVGFPTVEESYHDKKDIHRDWSNNDLIAQVVLFFIAGFETVTSAMCFMLYELALNPDVQEKLAKEIQEADARSNGHIDLTTIQEMKYLDMVVSETLRLWVPVFALDRICVKDYNLGKPNEKSTKDYIIKKGEGLQIPVFAIHRDPEYFPDPLKFDPERFSDENKHNINPFAYIPFGAGPRNCIGSRFALCQLKILVCHLLKNLEVSPGPRTCIPLELDKSTFNVRMKEGFWLHFKVRN